MHPHPAVTIAAAFLPLLIGFVWYSKPLFGSHWVRAANFGEGGVPPARMGLVVILTILLSLLLTMALTTIVIHQAHLGSIVANLKKDPEAQKWLNDSMAKYGNQYRTFKHGAFHGVIAALFFAMPVMGIIALFERKSFRYVAVHTGYWMLTLGLMGGVLCQWF